MAQIGNLNTSLSLESASFLEGVKRVKSSVDQLDKNVTTRLGSIQRSASSMTSALKASFAGLSAAAIGTVIGSQIKAGLEYASSLGEVAQQLGVTTATLQEYRYAATQVGISQDTLDAGLGRLTRSLGQAEAGNKGMAAAFRELGVTSRTADGALPQIIASLSKIPDASKRAALEVTIFGKSGQQLDTLLSGGVSQVDNLRNAAHRLGVVLSDDQIQSADNTADKLASVQTVLKANIAGVVASNADAIVSLGNSLAWLAGKASTAGTAYSGLWRIMQNEGMRGFLRSVTGDGSDQKRAGNLQTYSKDKIADFRTATAAYRRSQKNPQIGSAIRRSLLNEAVKARDLAIRVTGQYQQSIRQTASTRSSGGGGGILDLSGGGAKPKRASGGSGRSSGRKKPADDPAKDAQDILDNLFPDEANIRRLEQQWADLGKALAAKALPVEEYERAGVAIRAKLSGIIADGVLPGLQQMQEAANAETTAVFDELDRAATVTTQQTKNKFADMATSISSSLQNLGNALRGGNWLDILGAVISTGTQLAGAGAFGSKAQTYFKGLDGARANGGPVLANRSYLVGERGPEILRMGGRSGSIVANDNIGSGSVRVEVVANDYFDARVDGRSAAQAGALVSVNNRRGAMSGRQRLA